MTTGRKIYEVHTENEICPIYADSEEEAIRIFKKYNPRRSYSKVVLSVPKAYSSIEEFYKENVEDEHEFLLALIEAINDCHANSQILEALEHMYI